MKSSKTFICHYSEIGLKGRNRKYFVKTLKFNLRRALKAVADGVPFKIMHVEKRLMVYFDQPLQIEAVYGAMQTVFGLANFSAVQEVEPTLEAMRANVLDELAGQDFETFVIRSRRIHKTLPFNSMEVNREIGAAVVEKLGKKVDLKHAQCTVHIEIFRNNAFITAGKQNGPGGLPVSSSGRVMALMSGGFDSPIAAYYAMKRGARCEYIHFHSFPFTNKASQEKVKSLVTRLNRFQGKATLFMVPFTETQQDLIIDIPDKYRIIFYRRFMMRIAARLAAQRDIRALLTGESLGQVASQTLENMAAVEQVTRMPVLRPLIGLDKNEIMDIARRIGTYDISVLPHDDACTRFMPENPVIHSDLQEVLEIEAGLDVEGLVQSALDRMEKLEL